MTVHLTLDDETVLCGLFGEMYNDLDVTTIPLSADCADCLDAIAPDPDDIDASWDGDTWADIGMTRDDNGVWHA